VQDYPILLFAFCLALAAHLFFLVLLPGSNGQSQEQKLLSVELYQRLRDSKQALEPVQAGSKPRAVKARDGSRQAANISLQEQLLHQGRSPFSGTVLSKKLQDPELQAALESVQKRIAQSWQQSMPPESGRVEVRLVLNSQGEIISLWVLKLKGSPVLAKYVQDLLQGIAPFPKLEQLPKGQMTVDCAFIVQQG
jgi:outer membrane biosynthesis protein TonB